MFQENHHRHHHFPLIQCFLRNQILLMCKIFSLIPSKNPVTRENWDKLSVNFSIFEWWCLQLYKKITFGSWQFGNIGVLVNFINQKLKSKHLVCLSFFWWQVFFEGTRENIFHLFRALVECHLAGCNFYCTWQTMVRPKAVRNLNGLSLSRFEVWTVHEIKTSKLDSIHDMEYQIDLDI